MLFGTCCVPNAAGGRLIALRQAILYGGNKMKNEIHPTYGESTIRCACGETFKGGSVKGELKVEICSKCHPFYTGRQKLIDSGGRVDRFKKRYGIN